MRNRAVTALALVAALTAIALTLCPWVDLRGVGLPWFWNGLGRHGGEYADHYLDDTTIVRPLGWIVLATSVLAAAALIAAPLGQAWLRFVAAGSAAIGCATAALCVTAPAVLVDLAYVGAADLKARAVTDQPVLIAEAASTAVLLVCAVLLASRRAQPAAAPPR